MVDTQTNFDLEVLLADGETVDFNRGLTDNERKERYCKKGIYFRRMGPNYFAAPNMPEEVSVKTIEPGKKKSSNQKKKGDEDTLAESIMTHAGSTIVAQEIVKIDNESSLSSNSSGESVGVNEFMAMKYDWEEVNDEDGDNSDQLETGQLEEEELQKWNGGST